MKQCIISSLIGLNSAMYHDNTGKGVEEGAQGGSQKQQPVCHCFKNGLRNRSFIVSSCSAVFQTLVCTVLSNHTATLLDCKICDASICQFFSSTYIVPGT